MLESWVVEEPVMPGHPRSPWSYLTIPTIAGNCKLMATAIAEFCEFVFILCGLCITFERIENTYKHREKFCIFVYSYSRVYPTSKITACLMMNLLCGMKQFFSSVRVLGFAMLPTKIFSNLSRRKFCLTNVTKVSSKVYSLSWNEKKTTKYSLLHYSRTDTKVADGSKLEESLEDPKVSDHTGMLGAKNGRKIICNL